MKLSVNLKTNQDEFPMIYNHRIMRLINQAIQLESPEYYLKIKESKKIDYTFNLIFNQQMSSIKTGIIQIDKNHIVEDNIMVLENKSLRLYVSSNDVVFIGILKRGLEKLETFNFSIDECMITNYKEIELKINTVNILDEIVITDETVTFKTNSPILLSDLEGNQVDFMDIDLFNKELNQYQNKLLLRTRGYGLYVPLVIENISLEKQVVKNTNRKFREETGHPIWYLDSVRGTFKLIGDVEDLNYIYNSGLGQKTSQGFGMLEIIN